MARILIAKLGTDAHDYGARIVARWLSDAGHEVIYLGLYNTPERVAQAALNEDVAAVGLSFLGGEPVYLSGRVRAVLDEKGLCELPIVVGGVITSEMTEELKRAGVQAVFTPGTPREMLLAEMRRVLARGAAAA